MSWLESHLLPDSSSSSYSFSSPDDSSEEEPNFIIPRQGPCLEFFGAFLTNQRQYWSRCLVGVMTPNMVLEDWKVDNVPIWVELWGLHFEYYSDSAAEVRVRISPEDPLVMGFYITLDDGRLVWIQCRYERIFCIYRQCGCIGHLARDCKKGRRQAQEGVDRQKRRIRDRFQVPCFIDLECPLFVPDAVAFRQSKNRKTTRIEVRYEPNGIKYHTYEFRPIQFLRTESRSSLSPPPPTNVIRISEDSSSESVHKEMAYEQMDDSPVSPDIYYSNLWQMDSHMHRRSGDECLVNDGVVMNGVQASKGDKGKPVIEEVYCQLVPFTLMWINSTFEAGEPSGTFKEDFFEYLEDMEISEEDYDGMQLDVLEVDSETRQEKIGDDVDNEYSLAKEVSDFIRTFKCGEFEDTVWDNFVADFLNKRYGLDTQVGP
ncbi:Pyruvate carboxyltransferase [Senna tora]|uniref:Pyruvate carboxyltransferase n=1 Tax=Senna tora TaxID=362788 RepID=A0A834TV32_9FABA|nr:Pyruvate carboxyltransferase [Senna tora]